MRAFKNLGLGKSKPKGKPSEVSSSHAPVQDIPAQQPKEQEAAPMAVAGRSSPDSPAHPSNDGYDQGIE